MDEENTERNKWNRKAFGGQCGNQVQWKFPGIYKIDPSQDFQEDVEPEQAIFSNQARLSAMGLRHQPSHKTFNLQSILLAICPINGDSELEGANHK